MYTVCVCTWTLRTRKCTSSINYEILHANHCILLLPGFFLTDAENNALFFFFFFKGSAAWSRVSGTWGWPESDRLPNRGFRLISWPLRCSRSACKFYYSQPCFSATADVLLLTVSVYQRSQMASATPRFPICQWAKATTAPYLYSLWTLVYTSW